MTLAQANPSPPKTAVAHQSVNHKKPVAKVALVTGGAKRVGRAVAIELAQHGLDIAFTYLHSADDAHQTAQAIEQLGRRCQLIQIDLTQPHAPPTIEQALQQHFGRLDVLVNNASTFDPSPLANLTLEQINQQMVINGIAPVLLMQQLAPMLASHYNPDDITSTGRIINFVDIQVMGQHLKGYMAYNMSKAALMEATMTAALELAPAITVNAIAPGVIEWADSYSPQARQAYMKRVPLARPGIPQDAATAVRFLACEAHYCTGQIIKIDGGRSLT